ncbi:MltR family transcriptional regulator [Cupriavidus taiwanensis]|uniref:Uncharacterized protein n=1 Tax=Cupriavidus taiwanensis TaxID=164546 RepID=A0A375J0A8_9BURK|nr:MltR family transcriptional regulator [Cupriavidus taiwanensis]SPR97363.1 hypothetical protein CBM2634_A170093 [Cupriavidus taiwanensis]
MTSDDNDSLGEITLETALVLREVVLETLKEFPPEAQESIKTYMKFRRLLSEESDRGCALVGAAYLDEEITKLLRSRMVENKSNSDALLNQGRPIGTFSAKIRVAYAMGLIPEDVFRDISAIREIRNKFAHLHGPLSFDDQSIRDQCRSLRTAIPSKKDSSPRARFIHVVTTVFTAMSIESRKARAQVPENETIQKLINDTESALTLVKRYADEVTHKAKTPSDAQAMADREPPPPDPPEAAK